MEQTGLKGFCAISLFGFTVYQAHATLTAANATLTAANVNEGQKSVSKLAAFYSNTINSNIWLDGDILGYIKGGCKGMLKFV